MTSRLPGDDIPENPWRDKEFLCHCYYNEGLSPRAIAYELGVSKSHVTVHMERFGILRPWRHEETLRRLYVNKGLSVDEIAARDEFDCSPTTVEKYLAEFGLIEDDPDSVTYRRLSKL